jgi:short-subunit dehydrogenase
VVDLRGKTVLLTGASTGIGPYIARRLHREGARLVLSARNQAALDNLAKELGDARVVVADLSRAGEPERLVREAGAVDVLVSNAGVPASGRLVTFTIEELDRAIAVNLRAGIVLARLLAPAMIEHKEGHMVFMASVAGKVPASGFTVYNATKFGIRGFGHALRAELRGTGVGVSLVSPTFVSESGMWAETGVRASVRETTPERVAEACVRAIRGDRAEVLVAPIEQRIFSRMVLAFPGAFGRFLATGAVPEEAMRRQEAKR